MNQTQRRLLWTRLAGIAAEHGHIACLGSDGVDIDVRVRDPQSRQLRFETQTVRNLRELQEALQN